MKQCALIFGGNVHLRSHGQYYAYTCIRNAHFVFHYCHIEVTLFPLFFITL